MSFLDDVFGAKPNVPNLQPTDPLAELGTLLGGEIKDWPQIEQLSSLYQNYMLGALDEAVPGFSDILKTGGQDAESLLQQAAPLIQGQLPPDVQAQVERSAAFQSLGSGTAGSPMGSALTARDLGLTSLDLMNQGANLATAGGNAAQRWAGIAQGTILSPSQSLYSPEWFSTFMAQQRASQQAIAQQKANVAAAPSPALQALNQWVEQVGGSIVSSYAGGGMGGGKGSNYQTSYNPAQYLGGNVSTPGGSAYGSQFANPAQASYYTGDPNMAANPFNLNAGGDSYIPYGQMPYNIPVNPFNQGYNFSLGGATDPAQPGYFGI